MLFIFLFLWFKFRRLGGERFKEDVHYCALRAIILTDHIKNQLKLICMMSSYETLLL